MTIQEAAKTWGVKERTVFDYILKGYIYNLLVEDNVIMIPSIPKPYVKRKPKTIAEYDTYILNAMNKNEYVNAKIMGISQEKFEERLNALIKAIKIFSQSEGYVDYSSNIGFILAPEEGKNIVIAPSIDIKPTVEVKVADQIGVINGKVG